MVCSSKAPACLGWAGLEAEEKKLLASVTFWTQTPMTFPLKKQAGMFSAKQDTISQTSVFVTPFAAGSHRAGLGKGERSACRSKQQPVQCSAVQLQPAHTCSCAGTDPGLLGLCTPSM